MKKGLCLLFAFVVSGCASHSANMQIGNDQSYISLKDQREALRTVKTYEKIPDGATILGNVEASRCHRDTVQSPPTESNLINDLRITAYAKGADGITDIEISKESGLTLNCWYILDGKATTFMMEE